MKSLAAISFIVAILWQPFYQTGYIGYWEINKDKIAKTECINRFKPMMHCNGKCQLYRQLKKAADEEAENNRLPMAVLKIKTLDTFIDAAPQWHWDVVTVDKVSCLFFTTTESVLYGYSLSLLKPPQLTT